MDQISGLMPQIGWSPLGMPATPKKPPASTVEPAAKSASANGGMGAHVDTQTPQDHAQSARLHAALAEARVQASDTADNAFGPTPDPEAPTGPPPTFDVTPLEAMAAAGLSAPDPVAPDPAPELLAADLAEDSVAGPQAPTSASAPASERAERHATAQDKAAPSQEAEAAQAKAPAVPDAPQQPRSLARDGWHALAAPEEPKVNLMR